MVNCIAWKFVLLSLTALRILTILYRGHPKAVFEHSSSLVSPTQRATPEEENKMTDAILLKEQMNNSMMI